MPTQVQFRRGTTAQVAAFTGAAGEVVVDTSKNTMVVQDGSTAGGFALAKEATTTASFNTANAAFAAANNVAPQVTPAFNTANGAYTVANAAFDYANASNTWANTLAFSTGISATAWANTVGAAGNSYTNAVGTAGNNYATVTFAPKLSPSINNPTLTGTATINANIANQILTDGATINWDVSLGSVATVTLGGNRTVAAPTNLKIGTYILHVIQDGTGGRTLTWNSLFKWPAGIAPVLTTTGNRRDLFSFVSDGTNLYGSYLPDVR